VNSAYLPALLWDGKFPTLEEQAIAPIENGLEMGTDVNVALAKLQSDANYVALFQQAYGEGPTLSTLKRAIACFERTLYSAPSKFDTNTLNTSEANGKALFFGKANCSNCHSGFMFSDFTYQNTGRYTTYPDSGRAFITHNSSDLAKFRVPPLRNIAATAPFMHDGKVNTLEDIVNFYNSGGVSHPNKNPIIQPLNLTTQERLDLVNFLKAI
jgi:cytochrome c peroxidase